MESIGTTDAWHVEDARLAGARERGHHVDLTQPSPTLGAFLRVLASAMGAEAVVQVGADSGVSGLYLLDGMADGGVLTSIESVPVRDRAARETFRMAETGNRVRSITGDPHEVIARLTDGAYDLVLVGADVTDRAAYLDHARRLLRAGGTAIFLGVFGPDDDVLDQARREPEVVAARRFLDEVMEDEQLRCALLPMDHGTLVIELG